MCDKIGIFGQDPNNMKNILLLLTLAPTLFLHSQTSSLDLKEIMKGKDFIGYWPESQNWHVDGETILFRWNPDKEVGTSWYSYSTKTKKTKKVDLANENGLVFYDETQRNYTRQYYSQQGDLRYYDKKTKKFQVVYGTSERVYNIQRLTNPDLVAFQKGNNLFIYNASTGSINQITDFRLEDEKPAREPAGSLIEQQKELFQFIREENEEKAWRKENAGPKKRPTPLYFGKNDLYFVKIDPSGSNVIVAISSKVDNKETHIENPITANGYTKTTDARPKVGEEEPVSVLFIYSLEQDTLVKLDIRSLTDFQKKPLYFQEYAKADSVYTEDRKVVFQEPIFHNNGKGVIDIRSCDNKDRWLAVFDFKNFQLKQINHQHDEAWIGGPGIEMWDVVPGVLGWMKNGEEIYFQSEQTGYSHLYSYNLSSKSTKALTSGKFEIHGVRLSNDGNSFYLTANKTHPGNRELYQVTLKDLKWTTIHSKEGAINASFSPDEKLIAALISDKKNPWELYLGTHSVQTQFSVLTQSKTPEFQKYAWKSPEVITIKGKDGQDVYARVYGAENKNGAGVIFVHGAGYLQNAHNYWSNYYREYMFHNLLSDLGYTVMDIDYRASEGYGRDCRTAIYRHMGGMDLSDQLSGKDYLVQQHGIDPARVGIYGGSYGGFITLMALLTEPNAFACGAALRSVTDWEHYNHEYTSNILNYPSTDPNAYRQSSPIYFAENLNKPLVLLHGMVDDNVQFQDVVRLSQRFIELGKTGWDLAVYPVEAHGFVKSYSWTDEYRRILELFNRELLGK